MNLGLEGKVALVTGGSKGIGKAIVEALLAEGARVAFCARGRKALDKMVQELRGFQSRTFPAVTDVRSRPQVRQLIRRVRQKWGRLDVLVNNVGEVRRFITFQETTERDWIQSWQVNFLSAVWATKEALLHLKRESRIINISSILGKQPYELSPQYCAAKAAVINLSKFLSNELAPRDITVNTICPGPVWTDSWDYEAKRIAQSKKVPLQKAIASLRRIARDRVALKRIGTAEEVASLALYLASHHARWITGACFCIDGGAYKAIF